MAVEYCKECDERVAVASLERHYYFQHRAEWDTMVSLPHSVDEELRIRALQEA
jgi:hypothetical protein